MDPRFECSACNGTGLYLNFCKSDARIYRSMGHDLEASIAEISAIECQMCHGLGYHSRGSIPFQGLRWVDGIQVVFEHKKWYDHYIDIKHLQGAQLYLAWYASRTTVIGESPANIQDSNNIIDRLGIENE